MAGGRRFILAAGRYQRIAVAVAIGATLAVLAGLWAVTRQSVILKSHQSLSVVTLAARTDFLPAALGPCHWTMRVLGKPARGQAYLARCYLRALAQHNAASMHELSEFVPRFGFRSQITDRELADAADARAGVATVTFVQSPVDAASTTVRITFADGAREVLAAIDMSPAMGEPAAAAGYAWRLQIGSKIKHQQ